MPGAGQERGPRIPATPPLVPTSRYASFFHKNMFDCYLIFVYNFNKMQQVGRSSMSPKLPRITGIKVIRALRRANWFVQYQHGSHVYLRHPDRPDMRVTVPVHSGEVIKPKTLQSILEQAGLTVEEFQELL